MAHGIKFLSLPWITVANEEWPVDSQKSWPRQNVFSGLMCMGSILLFPVHYWKKKQLRKLRVSIFPIYVAYWEWWGEDMFWFFTKYLRDVSSSALDPLVSGLMCMGSILLFPVHYWKKKQLRKLRVSIFPIYVAYWEWWGEDMFWFFTKYLRDISSSALDPLV